MHYKETIRNIGPKPVLSPETPVTATLQLTEVLNGAYILRNTI